MSSINLDHYRARHGGELNALGKFESLLQTGRKYIVTLDQLADLVGANSRNELALILGELSSDGLVDFELQIRSPSTRERIAGYKNIKDIPSTLHDTTTDTDFTVSFDDVRPVYKFPKGTP
jgi:hypothetical protein